MVGGSRKLKPKQTAVVAYIPLNAPVPSERIEDAVWATPTASRRKRLANTISESRTALGPAHRSVSHRESSPTWSCSSAGWPTPLDRTTGLRW